MKRIISLIGIIIVVLACTARLQAQTWPSGLVSWWQCESNILDSVGPNNGAVYAPPVTFSYVPGEYGQAFSFSGGLVQVPKSVGLEPLTNLTVQAWVQATPPGFYSYLISSSQTVGGTGASSYGFYTGYNDSIIFYVFDGTNHVESPQPAYQVPWDDNWHMVTGTYDGSAVHLYLDGFEVGSGTTETNNISYADAGPLIFGDYQAAGGQPFNGNLDEIKVFNVALSASDALNTYENPNDPAATNGLVSWWRAEGNTLDSWGTNNGTSTVVAPKPFYFVPGKVGLAMFPQGGVATVPDSPSLEPANLTFQAWVKSVAPGTYKYVANKSQSGGGISYALYTGSGGGLSFFVYDGSSYWLSPAVAAGTIWDGRWHLADGTYDGSAVRLYIDGAQVGAGTSFGGAISYASPAPLVFGDYEINGGLGVAGEIDEVQLYNRGLAASEVMSNYQSYAQNGPVSWWPANTNANDAVGTNNGVLADAADYMSDPLGSGNGFHTKAGSVQIPDSSSLQLTNLALEAWVGCVSPGANKYIVSKSFTSSSASYALSTGPGGGLEFYVTTGGGVVASPTVGPSIWDGLYHFVVGVYDGQAVHLFVDGNEVGSGTPATGPVLYGESQSSGMLIFGDFSAVPAGANFPGYIAQVKLFSNVGLELQEMASDFAALSTPVMMFTQPASQSVVPGANVTLSASAKAILPLTYQWMFDGTNLPGATSTSLTLTNVLATSAGSYNVLVSAPGLTYTAGESGQAFNDASGAMIRVPNDPAFAANNFSVQVWAKSTAAAFKYLISKTRDPVAYNDSYALYTDSGDNLTWAVCLSSTNTYGAIYLTASAGTAVWDNNWHQITGTWDGEFANLYVDGVLFNSVDGGPLQQICLDNSLPTNIVYSTYWYDGDVVIGDYDGVPSTAHWPGSLDDVKYFSYALTASNVMDSYTNGPSATSDLVSWWQANGNTLDSVGSNHGLPITPPGTMHSSTAVITLNAAIFNNITVSSGLFRCTLNGPAGVEFTIQKSSNLINWVPVFTNTVPFIFTDPVAGGSGGVFYRAVATVP